MRIRCSVEHCTDVVNCSADGQLGLWDMNFTYNIVLLLLYLCYIVALFSN